MKTYNFKANVFLFLISFVLVSLVSCKCKPDVTSRYINEYIHYTVNGTAYNYDMPVDSVFADTLAENQTFMPTSYVFGARIPHIASEVTRIIYSGTNISVGSQQRLFIFANPQTEAYYHHVLPTVPLFVTITEYGAIGEFISGNFNALITGSAPGNLQYHVSCEFRVRRRI